MTTDEGDFEDELVVDNAAALVADQVDVVLGAAASGQTSRVIDDITAAGIVLISPSNTSDSLTDHPDAGLYFRTSPPDVMQARALSELLVADGRALIAILAIDEGYGIGLAAGIRAELVAAGVADGDIVTDFYDPGGDFAGELAVVNELEPAAVVLLGFDETAALIEALALHGFVP